MQENLTEASLGEPNLDKAWTAAIILQGPYVKPHTEVCIRMFLQRNPDDVLVIVSTYLPPAESSGDILIGSFLSEFEINIINNPQSPYRGRLVYLFARTPSSPDFWRTNYLNQNRQRLTTFIGLQYADQLSIPLALKCRSEAFLGETAVCSTLAAYVQTYPIAPTSVGNMKGRIVVSDYSRTQQANPTRRHLGEHHIADFWMFGYTQDLMNYFDMRKGSTWDEGRGISKAHDAEENLAECWMRNVGIPLHLNLIDLASRYLIIINCVDVEFVWLKSHHKIEPYLSRGKEYLAQYIRYYQRAWTLFHHEQWLKLNPKLPP